MKRWVFHLLYLLTIAHILGLCGLAEHGVLVVQVKDANGHPVSGVEIGLKSCAVNLAPGGGSAVTVADGYARIGLFKGTEVNDWVCFKILHSPLGRRYVINSPWYYEDRVPPFDNESVNFVKIVVVPFGDRAYLKACTEQLAMAARTAKTNAPRMGERDSMIEDRRANVEAVAKLYGVTPADVDRAVRAVCKKSRTPFEAGLSMFYERDYERAADAFNTSIRQCDAKRQIKPMECAYAAFFLGESLYAQGKYSDAAQAYRGALGAFKDDLIVLNSAALSLKYAGDLAGAEKLFRKILEMNEKIATQDEKALVPVLNNLADELAERSNFSEAETLYERALAIEVGALGWNRPEVATILNNRGWLSKAEKNYAAAERDYDRALAIRLLTLRADHPDVATSLNNLGVLLLDQKDYAGAEPLLREALAIREKSLPPSHPLLADSFNNLGSLLTARGNFEEAEPLDRKALAIRETRLGPSHPQVAQSLNNLGMDLAAKGDYIGAKAFLERALTICTSVLGPDNELTGVTHDNLKHVLQKLNQRQPN